jgi:ketosteroid isomerase-like protein
MRRSVLHLVWRAIPGLVLISMLNAPAVAHPINPVPKAELKLQNEITSFRKDFQQAAIARDAVALRRFYTEDFTHTHTSGKVDGKDARIVSVIAGEPTVEMAPVPEFNLSCFGDSVCIARALSPIKRGTDGKWFDVRWTQTYVRTSQGWQIAISQATGLMNTVRDSP